MDCKGKGKAIVLCQQEQVLARLVGLMRQFQLEQFWALLRVEENPKGKTTRHWWWKGERHPTCGPELNPGHSGERQMCYHGATRSRVLVSLLQPHHVNTYIECHTTHLLRLKIAFAITIMWTVLSSDSQLCVSLCAISAPFLMNTNWRLYIYTSAYIPIKIILWKIRSCQI